MSIISSSSGKTVDGLGVPLVDTVLALTVLLGALLPLAVWLDAAEKVRRVADILRMLCLL